MSDKFRNCFIDDDELYTYDIEFEGELIATAHSLSAKDRSIIEKKSMTKSFAAGEMNIDIDSHALKSWQILQALNKWELPKTLNFDNISMLKESIRDCLFTAIQDHEARLAQVVEETEKN